MLVLEIEVEIENCIILLKNNEEHITYQIINEQLNLLH